MTYIQINVPDQLWKKYKKLVNKEITLQESIIILIAKAIKKGKMITLHNNN